MPKGTRTMEDNRRGGFGRRTEGRRDYGRNDSNKGNGTHSEHRSYGEKPSRNFGEKRSFGDKPSYGRNSERPSFGERRSYGSRPSFGGNSENRYSADNSGRRSYGDRPRNSADNPERKSYGSRPRISADNSERRSFGERPRNSADKSRSFGERKSFADKKRSFDRKPGSRPGSKGFGGRKRSYGDMNYFRNEDESGISRMINRRPQIDSGTYSDNDMVMTPIKEEVRLNKFIANSGICSRREADNFILAGVVTVNGEVVTELGTKININTDDVRFNGERLKGESKVYIVMNKPKGYVTTASDPHADKTVMDLLKKCPSRVFPVGRLDKNTTGVLMFTNDGEIAEKLTHPSYDKKKIYQVSLDSKLKQEDFDKIMSGVELSDGVIAADALEYIEDDDHRKLGIEIHSGKNRIVRRIFESLGYEVKALDRVYFAGLTKKGIKRGDWRYLTEGETNLLKMGAYL